MGSNAIVFDLSAGNISIIADGKKQGFLLCPLHLFNASKADLI